MHTFTQKIFEIKTEKQFIETALEVFKFQYSENQVYREFVDCIGTKPNEVNEIRKIPFLPIEFFKTHNVICGENTEFEQVFTSSGTGLQGNSKHFIKEAFLYEHSFIKNFENFYGAINNYCFLALLPSYLEREGSSLIYMLEHFIKKSGKKESGFYLYNHAELIENLRYLESKNKKSILIGVSFALLDLAENSELCKQLPELRNTIIMETGGMKGRRKEIVREELHEIFKKSFNVKNVHSEYGMTELLSQAYSYGNSVFNCPPWMKVLIRDAYDPFCYLNSEKSGGINIIDLANLYSCSFIQTMDIGKIHLSNQFEVIGRFDYSDIRGCNLLI